MEMLGACLTQSLFSQWIFPLFILPVTSNYQLSEMDWLGDFMTSDTFSSLFWRLDPLKGEEKGWLEEVAIIVQLQP